MPVWLAVETAVRQAVEIQEMGGGTTDVALKVYCPQNQVDTGIMEQQQQAFAAAHPEYNITWTTEIVGEDKCAESILKDVGAAADVFMFANDQLPSLVEAGAIARLGGEAETMVKETNAESVIATVTVDDAVYRSEERRVGKECL